jgi:hypothetical protein
VAHHQAMWVAWSRPQPPAPPSPCTSGSPHPRATTTHTQPQRGPPQMPASSRTCCSRAAAGQPAPLAEG